MGYRINHHPRPLPHRGAVDIATPVHLTIHNGTTASFAFPCWYIEVHKPIPAHPHNYHYHDFIGAPSWKHPDHSCQLWEPDHNCCKLGHKHPCSLHCKNFLDMRGIKPIHFLSDYEHYFQDGAVDSDGNRIGLASVVWNTPEVLDDDGNVVVQAMTPPKGMYASAEIDKIDDWVVRLNIIANDPNALQHPQHYRLTTFVHAPSRQIYKYGDQPSSQVIPARTDIIALADLTVLPSSYDASPGNTES